MRADARSKRFARQGSNFEIKIHDVGRKARLAASGNRRDHFNLACLRYAQSAEIGVKSQRVADQSAAKCPIRPR